MRLEDFVHFFPGTLQKRRLPGFSPAPDVATVEELRNPELVAVMRDRMRLVEEMAAGDLETVRALVTEGQDAKATFACAAPLHFAIASGSQDLVAFLVANGADVNARNVRKETPLHVAVWFGTKALAELLLEHGADTEALGRGATPLHHAVQYGRVDIAELLLAKGLV